MGYKETRRYSGKRNYRENDNRRSREYEPSPPCGHPVHVSVRAKPGEHVDRTIKRFNRKVKKLKVLELHKEKTSHFIKDSEKRRKKKQRKKALIEKQKKLV